MKNSYINIRVSENFRDELEEIGKNQNLSISEIARLGLTKYVDELIIGPMPKSINNSEVDLLQSLEFTEFIFWVYEKKRNPDAQEIIELYNSFIRLIESFQLNELFANHPVHGDGILKEFEKVYKDLKDYVRGDLEDEVFTFASDEQFGLDYDLLADWFYCLRYDEDNNKIINLK